MKNRHFLTKDEPMLVSMLQAYTPERVLELMEKSRAEGADAFGMQFCRMKKEYRARETYERLFAAAGDCPVYVTNYRQGENAGKSDDILARELVELAEFRSCLTDDLMYCAVHASRAESRYCIRKYTFGPCVDFLFLSHYSTSLMNSSAPFITWSLVSS
jgi:hypothetical protein